MGLLRHHVGRRAPARHLKTHFHQMRPVGWPLVTHLAAPELGLDFYHPAAGGGTYEDEP